MPKPYKRHTSSLRLLRNATGMNQEDFANAIGTSKAIIENVEMGRTPLARELIGKIVAYTGVAAASLNDPTPRDFHGAEYTHESWEGWKGLTYTPEGAERLLGLASDYLRVLLVAAYDTPGGTQTSQLFRTLLLEFNHWIFDKANQHNLHWIIEQKTLALEALTRTETGTTDVGRCRLHMGGHPQWQANDDPTWPAEMEVIYSQTIYPLFLPFMAYGTSSGEPAFYEGIQKSRQIYNLAVGGKKFRVVVDAGTVIPILANKATPPPSGAPSPTPAPPAESPKTAKRPRASRARGSA